MYFPLHKLNTFLFQQTNREIPLFLLITFFTILRLWVAPSFGLGVDEAHYLLYAKYLDFSYVDHPPLVGWAHAPLYYLFGTSELLVRLPAILLSALTSYLVYRFMMKVSGSTNISLLAVLALNSSFLFNALGLMLLPDCFLLPLTLLLIFVIKRIEESAQTKDFIYLGFILGLSGLAKYTSILLLPPLLVYLIGKRRYDLLLSKNMVASAAIALLCIVPVLYWNLRNDFVSFRYQGSHILGPSSLDYKPFLISLGAQFGTYSPFLFLLAFYGFCQSFRSQHDLLRLSLLLGGTILVFFSYSSLYDVVLPHWSSLFYLLFIPIGVYFLRSQPSRKKKFLLNFSIGVSLMITIFLYIELYAKFFSFPDFKSPFRDIYGLATISQEAHTVLEQNHNPKKALAVTDWTMGSRLIYYSLPYNSEVFVIDKRKDQFDFWQEKSPLGYDLLFLNTYFSREDIARRFLCDEVTVASRMEIMLNESKVDRIEYVWCKNYQGEKDESH